MIRLSTNVVIASIRLLEIIDAKIVGSINDITTLPSVAQVGMEEVYEFSQACKWVEVKNNDLVITKSGKEILLLDRQNRSERCFREILQSYIIYIRPVWSSRIPYGRKEASLIMSKDERACFCEGSLLSDNPSQLTVEWWDNLASIIRKDRDENKNAIGRSGERLTLDYERKRTDSEPQWVSIDSNLSGYDIKSIESKECNEPLLIEVKASEKGMNDAEFYVTSNEWLAASAAKRYLFYLWLIGNKKNMLAIVDKERIEECLPQNQKSGRWETVKIPYKPFEESFFEVE